MNSHQINPEQNGKKAYNDAKLDQIRQLEAKQAKSKNDLNSSAMIYKTMGQLTTLAATCKDVTSASATNAISAPSSVSSAIASDPVQSIGALMDSFKQSTFSTNPSQFYQQVLMTLLDASQIPSSYLKNLVVNEVRSRLGPCLSDPANQKSLSLCLAQGYSQAFGQTPHTSVLKMCLNLLLGPDSSSLSDATIKTYQNCILSDNQIPNLKKNQKQIAAVLTSAQSWQTNYNQFLEKMNKGDFSVKGLVSLVESAPKGTEHQMNMLAKWVGPLIENQKSRDAMSKALCFHFAQEGKLSVAQQKLEAFGEKLHLAMPIQMNRPVQALIQNAGNGLATGPLNSSNPMTSQQISSSAQQASHSVGASSGPSSWMHHIIHDCPIMMALYVVLMSGSGAYGFLAAIMGNLNITMGDVQKFVDTIKNLQDSLNDFMTQKDPTKLAQDAANIAADQKQLNGLTAEYGNKLGPDLVKAIDSFAADGTGSLDQAISSATSGADKSWEDLANDPKNLQKVQDYFTGPTGGSAPADATTVLKNISDLMGSLSTQNQAEVEKLNLETQKVDSLTKLFASSLTMYKGLIQTLTNFSGS